MDKRMDKDWTEAVREQCLSDEMAPSPDGWSQIGHRMRRAAAIRRSAFAVGALVPVAALLLWAPWRQASGPVDAGRNPIAMTDTPSRVDETPVEPAEKPVVPADTPVIRRTPPIHPDTSPINPDITPVNADTIPAIPDPDPVIPGTPPVIPSEAKESTSQPDRTASIDPFEPIPVLAQHQRPRLSLGVKAGSGTAHRNVAVDLRSAPYMAGLAYLNSYLNMADPAPTSRVRSNYSNTVGLGAVANHFFPESSSDRYRHDLPVSLGITARMDVNAWAGLESGIEYTYLHSSVNSVAGRLHQRLHFIGIPVRLDARLLSRGGFDFYVGVGAKAEKCIAASFGTVTCEEKRVQWSAEAFSGVQYGLWNHTHLFFQPEVSCYFTDTDLLTYRTGKPLTLTLQAGLRFDL